MSNNKDISLKEKPKPFVKWAGGKSQLITQLKSFFPKSFNNYFEPFVGGGVVLFYLKPVKAYINDINKALMYTYKIIKEKPLELISLIKEIQENFYSNNFKERKEYFYEIRDKYNTTSNNIPQKAAFFIFLNKTCYNGMYRENSKGEFNVPYGKYKNPQLLDEDNILTVSRALKNVTILCGSFENSISKVKANDFVYLDPPYHPLNATSSFTSYTENRFTKEDQIRLKNVFIELDKRNALIMLSNSYTDFIIKLYKGYRQEIVMANRAINCKASGRGKIKEIIILNY